MINLCGYLIIYIILIKKKIKIKEYNSSLCNVATIKLAYKQNY